MRRRPLKRLLAGAALLLGLAAARPSDASIVERIVLGTKNDGNGFTFRWAACQSAETF